MLPKPRAILFDWDGTMVDTWKAIIAAYNITRIAMGMDPWDETTARHNIRKSWRDAFPEVFGDRWEEASKIYREQYGALNQDHIEPMRGAFELLDDIKQLGIYCAVVSNKSGPFLREEVKYFNWGQHFTCVVGAGDAKRDKPHGDPVLMALGASGIIPGPDVWFVGDTGMDMQTAYATGCTPILVSGFNLRQGELENYPPHAEFDDLYSLHDALRAAVQSGKNADHSTDTA
ncbi:MAG TPA: HAD hydrolase-like protein [Alphaproteobacteria bacterium]|nr:HAD hydrolase-like protein [Alphaproteobacteria bacterium]